MFAPADHDTQTEVITVARHRIRTRSDGTGPPLLLLMGIGGNAEMWDPLRAHLAGRRLIAFDVPGSGESTTPRLPLTMARIADLAAEVLQQLGVPQADVLGVSWGGVLAQTVAIRHPTIVRRLVLAATSCGVGSVLGRPAALRILATRRRYVDREYLEKVAPALYGGRIRSEPELLRQQTFARLTRPPSRRGYIGQVFAINSISTLPFARCIKSPTLIITGADDPLVPQINSRMLHRAIRQSILHVVEGGGHLFLLDSAPDVAPVIAEFLDHET